MTPDAARPAGVTPGAGSDRPPGSPTVEGMLRERLTQVLGGGRGAVEAAVPTIAFVGLWLWRGDLRTALIASAVAVAAAVLLRLYQRQTTRYALSSVLATGIAAAFALRTGRAEDAFLPAILWNLAEGIGFLISVFLRWPVLGFVVAAADPRLADAADPADLFVLTQWRRHAGTVAVCSQLTLILAGLMLARVAIMLPLYLAGQVALLGVAKIALGWPAYLLVVAGMAAIMLRGNTPLDSPSLDSPSLDSPSEADPPRR